MSAQSPILTPDELLAFFPGSYIACYVCDTPLVKGNCPTCLTRHVAEIKRGLTTLFDEGDVIELRFFLGKKTFRGFYTKPQVLLNDVAELSADQDVRALYYVLNNIDPAILTRLKATPNVYGPGDATTDEDITHRRWFFIDTDPERDAGVSSTDAEKEHAHVLSQSVREYLREQGWPEPVVCDSSNGYHLLYRIDLPNDDDSDVLVNRCLKALHAKFSNAHCKVDTKVGNAARICKAYGSFSRKGDGLLDRPWRESRVVTAPDEVATVPVALMQALAATIPQPPKATARKLAEDFDINDFAAHYDLEIANPEGKTGHNGVSYFYLRSCPIKGAPHSELTKSALTLGETLGFSCFSSNCCQPDGSKHTITSLRKLLHKDHEPYPGAIYAPLSDEALNKWGLDEDEGDDDDDSVEDDEVEEQPLVDEVTVVPPARVQSVTPDFDEAELIDCQELDSSFSSISAPFVLNIKRNPVSAFPLDMPENCMYGWLKEAALTLDAPLGWGYASLMTTFAAQGVNLDEPEDPIRPTLYTCLLGPAGGGKTTAAERAVKTLILDDGCVARFTPGSEKGILKYFAAPTPKKGEPDVEPELRSHVMFNDEFKEVMLKANIQNSALATSLCILFYGDKLETADKLTKLKMNARLNILGCLKANDPTEFAESFGNSSTGGLYDRFLFIPGPHDWHPKGIWKAQKRARRPVVVKDFRLAFEMKDAWLDEQPRKYTRLAELALRIATITASANHETKISAPCMEAALRYVEWQEKVRNVYAAGVAQNPDAVVSSAILDAFAELGEEDGQPKLAKFWTVARNKNWSRKFGSAVTRVRKSLAEERALYEELEEVLGADGQPTGRTKPTGNYSLPRKKKKPAADLPQE